MIEEDCSKKDTELIISKLFVKFRSEIKDDIENLIDTKFSKLGIDITHQGSINYFHELMNYLKSSYLGKQENTSVFRGAVITHIMSVLLGILTYGVLQYLGK